MQLLSLFLKNFRFYDQVFFEFCPAINVICGSNACGKTTLLEAIYFLIAGRSFRGAQMGELIRHGEQNFFLEARFIKNGLEQSLKIYSSDSQRKILYNSTEYPSFSSLLGLLQGIVLSPDDIGLIKKAPATRRHYLDMQLAQVDPLYVHHLMRYSKAMRHRNHLLRTKQPNATTCWELEMAQSAAYVTRQRAAAVGDLTALGEPLHASLSGETAPLALAYKTTHPESMDIDARKQLYVKQYNKDRSREMHLGMTLTGPHRDDLTIALNQRDARFFASEGQQRSCVAALRFAEWERVRRLGEEMPLMLIDDFGTNLDEGRRQRLLSQIQTMGQVFATSTHELALPGKEIRILDLNAFSVNSSFSV